MGPYSAEFEVAGKNAIFTRPDSGAAPASYPVLTHGAAQGIAECVVRVPGAFLDPVLVRICRPVVYHRYCTNYGGPLRLRTDQKNGLSQQIPAVILLDVCYQVQLLAKPDPRRSAKFGINALHQIQEIFLRRLARGQTFHAPCLGWREFGVSYFGPCRPETKPEESINMTIPCLLHSTFRNGEFSPEYRQSVKIEKGVMAYA